MSSTTTKAIGSIATTLFVAFWVALIPNASRAQMIGDEGDIAEIMALVESAKGAYVDGDWDRFAGHFTEDALWMPNNQLPLKGESAWWSFVQRFWETTEVVSMDLQSEEIIVFGDWAVERHTEVTEKVRGDGEIHTSRFKGVWILNRTKNDSWKIARYIWNRNPAPEE